MRTVTTLLLGFALVWILFPAPALAQDTQSPDGTRGFAFVGIGAINTDLKIVHFGGGTEFDLYKGLGVGLEIGYLGPTCCVSDGVGVFSANGQYTFGTHSTRRLRPFVSGGYSLAFRNGHGNGINLGGGVHYWFSNRVGLRLEFRDFLSPSVWDAHAWQGRVGFDFR